MAEAPTVFFSIPLDDVRKAWKQDMVQTWEELKQKEKDEKPNHPYTKREVKQMFGVTYQTLDRWHKNEYLVNFKIGSRVYYKPEVVNAVFKKRDGDGTK